MQNTQQPALEQISQKQKETWNAFTPGWKKWDHFVMDFLKPIGEELIRSAELKENYLVLDVAAGTGEPGLTAATMVKKGKVIGTDISEEMIKVAEENARAKNITNYETKVCDAGALPFPDNHFDAVICRMGVMFFADPYLGLKELMRVLKPNGKIAVSVWNVPAKNPWATTIQGLINKMLQLQPPPPDAPGLFRCGEPGTLTKLMSQCGLKDVKEKEVSGELTFEAPGQYWNFMIDVAAPISTALSKVDEATRQQVKQTLLDTVKPLMKNGKLSLGWCAWVGSGVKWHFLSYPVIFPNR